MSADRQQVHGEPESRVMRCGELESCTIDDLADRYQLTAVRVGANLPIPGSYWGETEAGLAGGRIYWRRDTPIHSLLHELAHYVCMDPARRSSLDTDAGGGDEEECAVCYLEILLAGELPPFGSDRCLADMDAWGYSFREGSARRWFEGDGREARSWLFRHGLIGTDRAPTWRLRP